MDCRPAPTKQPPLPPQNVSSSSYSHLHDDYRDELMNKGARIGLVTYDRERQNSKELTVTKVK